MLYQLSLGNSPWQHRDDMNVISNSADVYEFGTEVAADCGQISVHSRPHVRIKERLAFPGAKDDVDDDFAE